MGRPRTSSTAVGDKATTHHRQLVTQPNPVPSARAVVSLAAPGQDFIVAAYTGDTTQTGFYGINAAGTSYSAPTVAGGATLVVDAGKNLFPTNPKAIDGRIIKAVLLNSADK